jgi:hypothetical protein
MLVFAVGFFALAYAFIKGCERIIGPDVEADRVDTERADEAAEEAAA